MANRHWISAFSVVMLVLTAGCTREVKEGKAAIKIAFPQGKMNSLSSAPGDIKVLIVNVTGPGIPTPIFYSWNNHDSTAATPPSPVSVSVPYGPARDIQVLVVYKASGGGMSINYGSARTDINDPTVTVELTVNNLSSSSGIEGRIAGRYMTTIGVGPTDSLGVFLTPPGSTLPPILVQQSEMIAGYFNIFGITDVAFTYKLGNGTLIFPPNSTLEPVVTNPLYPTNNATSMEYVPAAYRTNAGPDDEPKANVMLFGYFGPGANPSITRVCFDSSSGLIADAFLDAGLSVGVPWSISVLPLASMLNTSAGILAGSSLITCSGTPLSNHLKIERDNLASGDSSVPFKGPYMRSPSSNYLAFSSGGGLVVTWAYAPGVFAGPNPITGSQAFYMLSPGSQYFGNDDNGFDCGKLTTEGFTAVPPVTGAGVNSVTIPSLTLASDVEVIICPYRQEASGIRYFTHGVDGHQSSGSPFIGAPPYHFMLSATSVSPGTVMTPLDNILANTSNSVTLQVVDAQNRAVAVGGGTTLNLQTGYSMLVFDNTLDHTPVVLDSFGKNTFNIHTANNQMVTTLNVSYGGGISGTQSNGNLLLPVGPWTGEPLNIQIYTTMVAPGAHVGDCIPVEYALQDSNVLVPSLAPVTFTPTGSGGTFYSAPDCTGGIASSVIIPAGKVTSYLYFKPTSAGSSNFGFSGAPVNNNSVALSLFGTASVTVSP